jgi:hypothetical protein
VSTTVRSGAALTRIAETIVLTIAIPTVGYAVDRTDPFLLHVRFPWLVFAPLLVALRHGFRFGFASAGALAVALVLTWRTRLAPMAGFPGEPAVGLLALAMIAGQFADVWKREAGQLGERIATLNKEADALARSHFLLEASHDRLDEQVQRKTSSLRQAMASVNDLALAQTNRSLGALGDAIVEIFAAYCGIEIGELFIVERGGIAGASCGTVGEPEPMRNDDPLVASALRSARLTYVPATPIPNRSTGQSPLLAALPFVDSAGVVRAVLCVQAMPFMSFERRNLDTMTMIAATFADLASGSRNGGTKPTTLDDQAAMAGLEGIGNGASPNDVEGAGA